jgi:hypothetical protein
LVAVCLTSPIECHFSFGYIGLALGMSMALAVPKLLAALPEMIATFQQAFRLEKGGRRVTLCLSSPENGYVDW